MWIQHWRVLNKLVLPTLTLPSSSMCRAAGSVTLIPAAGIVMGSYKINTSKLICQRVPGNRRQRGPCITTTGTRRYRPRWRTFVILVQLHFLQSLALPTVHSIHDILSKGGAVDTYTPFHGQLSELVRSIMLRFLKQAVVGKKIGKSLFYVDVDTIDNGMNDREMEISEPTSKALPNVRPEQKLGPWCTCAGSIKLQLSISVVIFWVIYSLFTHSCTWNTRPLMLYAKQPKKRKIGIHHQTKIAIINRPTRWRRSTNWWKEDVPMAEDPSGLLHHWTQQGWLHYLQKNWPHLAACVWNDKINWSTTLLYPTEAYKWCVPCSWKHWSR